MTEEHTPTPAAASSSTGWPKARRAPPSPAGVTTTAAMSIEAASRSIPLSVVAGVWPALAARDLVIRGLAIRSPVVRGPVVRSPVVRGLAIRCPRIT
jgi:ABC-type spermidine/putrescine transport system permease subunit II